MEVVVDTPSVWVDPGVWPALEGLGNRITDSPVVARLLTPLDLLRKLRQWDEGFDPFEYRLPDSRDSAESLLAGLDDRARDLVDRFVADGGRSVRMSAIVNEMDEGRFLDLVAATRGALDRLPEGYRGYVTGMVLRLVVAQQRLVSSQLRSLGLAVAVVFLVIGVGLRSWRLTVLSIVPNVLPVLGTFCLMALARIPLDAATVMVASVALGIAVDNTVHLLTGYDRERRKGADPVSSVRSTLDRVGSALVITSVTAGLGFFALCLSAFVPIRDFGLLAGMAIVVALAADLLVVPALLVVTGRS
jgi:predicted RND superfamily exporter protein